MPLIGQGFDGLNKPFSREFAQVEYLLESFRAAVIRIRNLAFLRSRGKLHEQSQFAMEFRRALPIQKGQILPIHGQNPVETGEIRLDNSSGTHSAQVVSTLCGHLSHTRVGRFSFVIAVRSSGIHLYERG